MLLTYEKIQSLSTMIEAAKATAVKTSIQMQIQYRGGKNGYIEMNTNGIVDFVLGNSVKHVFEIRRIHEDRFELLAWDKVLDRVTDATIYYDEIAVSGVINILQHD